MCVVVVVEDQNHPITDEQLAQCHKSNGHGIGIAYVRNNAVCYAKGIANDVEARAFITEHEITAPYIVHFRIRSSGDLIPELTHPFPIRTDGWNPLATTDVDNVLFHNGTWHGYENAVINIALAKGIDIPAGAWSDTRGMAWILAMIGPNALKLMLGNNPSRLVTLNASGEFTYLHGSWDSHDGKKFSNMGWKPNPQPTQVAHTHGTVTHYGSTSTHGIKRVNIDGWSKLPTERQLELVVAMKRSTGYASTSNGQCLRKLYAGQDPQHNDYCGKCQQHGGTMEKICEACPSKVVEVTAVQSVLPAHHQYCSHGPCLNPRGNHPTLCDYCLAKGLDSD